MSDMGEGWDEIFYRSVNPIDDHLEGRAQCK